MKIRIRNMVIAVVISLQLFSCIDDSDWYNLNQPLDVRVPAAGLFIINEGNFMFDNASLSYYALDSMKVLNQVFYRTNNIPLGDVAQSMQIRDSLGYIVINNSGKIYVINTYTFKFKGIITGLSSPRHIHFVNDHKAYISDLYARSITIVDPEQFTITGSIPVENSESEYYQHPTEQMIQYGKYVFTNCWSFDNKILVIDTDADAVIDSLEVPKQPGWMVLDKHAKLWVLSDGGFEGNPYANEPAALTRIDAELLRIEDTYRFREGDSPRDLVINGSRDTLFFINQHVFSMPVTADTIPRQIVSSPYNNSIAGGYYALTINPENSDIYVADAIDHVQQGNVYRFSSQGEAIDTFKVGISPGAFCFIPKPNTKNR